MPLSYTKIRVKMAVSKAKGLSYAINANSHFEEKDEKSIICPIQNKL